LGKLFLNDNQGVYKGSNMTAIPIVSSRKKEQIEAHITMKIEQTIKIM